MNVKNIPADYAALEQFNVEYERTRFRYTETNRRVAQATRNMFLGWFLPRPLWKLGEPAVYAMMDDRLLEAFGFPKPSTAMRRFVEGALRLRGRLVRLLPERRRPLLRTALKRPTYPQGYRSIEELGPQIEKVEEKTA
ncbi:MAG: oxygenase MpaB family protein [Anaerolineales bacterium]